MLRKLLFSWGHLVLIFMGLRLLTNCVRLVILILLMARQSGLMAVMEHFGIKLNNWSKMTSTWGSCLSSRNIPNSSNRILDKMPEQIIKLWYQWWFKIANKYFQTHTPILTTSNSSNNIFPLTLGSYRMKNKHNSAASWVS